MAAAPPAAVLWDMDGTIVDTEPYWIECEYELVAEHGNGQWDDAKAHSLVGLDLRDSARRLQDLGGVTMEVDDIVNHLLDGVIARVKAKVPWRPGARELLAKLRVAEVPCALVTMSWSRFANAVVAALPRGTFAAVISGDEVRRGKPHPEPYLAAADALGVRAKDCVAVEDSPTGVRSAVAAGCRVFAVPNVVDIPPGRGYTIVQSLRDLDLADLGIDQLLVYRFNPRQGKLESAGSARVKAGGGPRHFTFHPNGRFAYVINELDSTVTAFSWDADSGRLKNLQTVATLPAEFNGRNSTAEIRVHPSGRFLYGSNRGHHSLAIFRINQQTGELTPAGHHSSGGSTPRNFNIHPNGRFLLAANQETGNVVVLHVDQQTGALSPTGQEVKVDFPVCVRFLSEVAN